VLKAKKCEFNVKDDPNARDRVIFFCVFIVEWFIDKGESLFTTWLYPSPDSNGLDFFTSGGAALF
jgi:hypothetical protein